VRRIFRKDGDSLVSGRERKKEGVVYGHSCQIDTEPDQESAQNGAIVAIPGLLEVECED
jgi:hypothetical protein